MNDEPARSIAPAWRRIEAWLRANSSDWKSEASEKPLLRPPADPAHLTALEAKWGPLPAELRELWALHDGCRSGRYVFNMRPTSPTAWRTMGMRDALKQWQLLESVDRRVPFEGPVRVTGPVRGVWWDARWLPLAESGTGDVICVDTHPAPGGNVGQLIEYMHDSPERMVLFPSILAWLEEYATDLEAGRYFDDEGIGISPIGLAEDEA